MYEADAFPVRCFRTKRPWHKTAPAIRADIVQVSLHAVPAKGALIGADHCIRSCDRQILVAIFAIGSEFEHKSLQESFHFLRCICEFCKKAYKSYKLQRSLTVIFDQFVRTRVTKTRNGATKHHHKSALFILIGLIL